jgi:hypothetical protein
VINHFYDGIRMKLEVFPDFQMVAIMILNKFIRTIRFGLSLSDYGKND